MYTFEHIRTGKCVQVKAGDIQSAWLKLLRVAGWAGLPRNWKLR